MECVDMQVGDLRTLLWLLPWQEKSTRIMADNGYGVSGALYRVVGIRAIDHDTLTLALVNVDDE